MSVTKEREEKEHGWNTFATGYVASGELDTRSPMEFERLLNAIVDDRSIRKRGGYDMLTAEIVAGSKVSSLYYTGGTTNRKIVCTAKTSIYGITPSTGAAAELEAALTADARWDSAEFAVAGVINVVMVCGSHPPRRWDGAAASTTVLTGPGVNCTSIMAHNGRLFLALGRTIYSTKLLQVDTYETQAINLDGDGWDGNITKLVSVDRNRALIFTERAVYAMTGSDIGSTSGARNIRLQFLAAIGCPAKRCFVRVGEELYFLGVTAGYYAFFRSDGTDFDRLCEPIRDDVSGVNVANIDTACAVQIDRNVLFCLPTGASTDTDTGFLFHRTLRGHQWSKWVFAKMPRCFARDPVNGTVYWGRQDAAFIARHLPTTFDDNATAIDMDVIFGPVSWDKNGFDIFTLHEVEVHAKVYVNGSIAASVGVDAESNLSNFTTLPGSPFTTGTSGVYAGDRGGATVNWSGVARKIMNAPKDLSGQCHRLRLRENSTNGCKINRVRMKAVAKAR